MKKIVILDPGAFDGTQGMEPGEFMAAAGGKVGPRSVLSSYEPGRHKQYLLTEGLERGIAELRRQT